LGGVKKGWVCSEGPLRGTNPESRKEFHPALGNKTNEMINIPIITVMTLVP
jgi:hypothetical protein